jgi:hypothetical protein
VTHVYDSGQSSYTPTLNVVSPSGCSGYSSNINTPGCSSSLGAFCRVLFGIITYGFAIAVACLLLSTCSPLSSIATALEYIAIISAVVAIVALIIYLIFCLRCPPCGWIFLILWRILFVAGAIYAIYAECCGGATQFYIGLGTMIVGLIFLILWAISCSKTFCDVMRELGFTLGWILGVVGILSSFSILTGCYYVVFFSITFLAIISTLFLIVQTYVAAYCQ